MREIVVCTHMWERCVRETCTYIYVIEMCVHMFLVSVHIYRNASWHELNVANSFFVVRGTCTYICVHNFLVSVRVMGERDGWYVCVFEYVCLCMFMRECERDVRICVCELYMWMCECEKDVCMCICVFVCMCMCVCVYACLCVCVYAWVWKKCVYMCMRDVYV